MREKGNCDRGRREKGEGEREGQGTREAVRERERGKSDRGRKIECEGKT